MGIIGWSARLKLNGWAKVIAVVLAVVINLIGIGYFAGEVKSELRALDRRMLSVEEGVRTNMDDRYRGTDAQRDNNTQDKRIERLEAHHIRP